MSIRAMNWAMEQATGDPRAQILLYVVADCANPDGVAWPSIKFMAAKSQQSKATVQRRLRELEDMGALVRFPRWEDEDGKINSEARGRRTSDEIRLLMNAHIDRFSGGDDGDSDAAPPSLADTPPSQPATAPVAQLSDAPPSHCSDPHKNLNSEPKDSPQPPASGGSAPADRDSGSDPAWPHAASWARVELAWGDPILHQGTCRNIWSSFADDERERFLRVIRGYLAWRMVQPKLPNRVNLQKLMREHDAWPGYEKLAGPDPSLRTFVADGTVEHRALQVIAQMGGWTAPLMQFDQQQGRRGIWRGRPLKPDEIAMAQFLDKPVEQWTLLPQETPSFYAWSDRLYDWTGVRRSSIRAPLPFPPRKDGTITTSTDPPKESSAA